MRHDQNRNNEKYQNFNMGVHKHVYLYILSGFILIPINAK